MKEVARIMTQVTTDIQVILYTIEKQRRSLPLNIEGTGYWILKETLIKQIKHSAIGGRGKTLLDYQSPFTSRFAFLLFKCLWKYQSILKGQCHSIFDFRFFHESIPPGPCVVDTSGAQISKYLCEFSTRFEMTLMLFSGAWGKKIHEKPIAKNLVTLYL